MDGNRNGPGESWRDYVHEGERIDLEILDRDIALSKKFIAQCQGQIRAIRQRALARMGRARAKEDRGGDR